MKTAVLFVKKKRNNRSFVNECIKFFWDDFTVGVS